MSYFLLSAAAMCFIVHSIYNVHGISAAWRERGALAWLILASAFLVLGTVLTAIEVVKGGAA